MNILLIRPKPDKETIGLQHVMVCEPLELEYLAANIDLADVKVEILDMILEKEPLETFIKQFDPDVVGMTGYVTHVNVIKNYAHRIKKLKPDCIVVAGGVYAEVVPADFVSPDIDYIVEANGPATFNTIINYLMQRKEKMSYIDGTYRPRLTSRKDTSFPYENPDRDKVNRYRDKYYYMFHNPCALIKTSYGCPYSCSFCFCKEVTDGKYFTRSIESVIEELLTIPEPEIYIVDDDFLFSRERILEFCSQLAKYNITKKFLVYGRADFVSSNADVIEIFRDHGLRAVIMGLESFKNDDLQKYNKRTSIIENEKAINVLKKYDIEIYGTIILGMDFSKADFQSLYQWLVKMDITFVNLQPLTPLYGTEIYQQYEKDLIIDREEYEKWDLAHLVLKPEKMSVRSYYMEIVKLYYKITMRPKNVLRLIRKYGLSEVLKLSVGSSAVTMQYLKKIIVAK
ncbi:B12-binding domain-containing radical SAM protein [Desulfuribacillus alkaliarsenatis]|uniref:B12-binding domain-containing radical SAM protein n=1 Tax=Desulfuribacillus alkaliarsenatis TaxID=766136 RepID=A0A1E5G5I4_9FIRM|nr:radical SAM protein [Desulfuribacillus alkaliarsenatis]OEF98369.1 B12-binding domain-containing radical SAM protein [Desulfuribacillus alkaliarsenatis]